MNLIITSLYFFLPAYIANMCPVFAGALKLPFGQPINDLIFGSHKSWRGFYSGYLGALGILFLQLHLQKNNIMGDYTMLNYTEINLFFYAFLFGIGAIFGDLAKSFFKRKLGKKAGSPWFPFDQLDFVIGGLIFLSPVYVTSWQNVLVLLVLTPLLHFLTNITAYFLNLKKVWW